MRHHKPTVGFIKKMPTTPEVTVPVKSPVASTVNWAQIAGLIASVVALFKLPLTQEQIANVIIGIQGAVAIYTVIRHTFFEKTVLAPSVKEELK